MPGTSAHVRVAARSALVVVLAVAAMVAAAAPAFAARATHTEGPAGSGAAVINRGPGKLYVVSVDAVNNNSDVAASSVQLDVVDGQGARTIREFYIGGTIKDSIEFEDRGPCTVQITFRFARVMGENQSNLTKPFMINYP